MPLASIPLIVISKSRPFELARQETAAAVQTLATIHRDKKAPYSARVMAANALLDRGWGKARQALEHSGADGAAVKHSIEVCFVDAPEHEE